MAVDTIAEPLEATAFKARWEHFANERKISRDMMATMPLSVADLRRLALEFFSWGIVHDKATRERLEALLPEPASTVMYIKPASETPAAKEVRRRISRGFIRLTLDELDRRVPRDAW